MSEERFDRIESQISQLRELIQQTIPAINQNINALREDVTDLRHRIDSIEGTQSVMIREGFKSLMPYNDDLNYELGDNDRQTRLLRRRESH